MFSFCDRILDDRIRKPGRVDQHRKSRSYCRAERPDRTKPLLGSRLFLKSTLLLRSPGATGSAGLLVPAVRSSYIPTPLQN